MIKIVLFDLDDTLISEHEYIKSGYSTIASYLSENYFIERKQIYEELLELFYIEKKNVFNRWFEKHGIFYSKAEVINLVNLYRNHIPNIKFFEDVIPLLEYLKEKEIPVGIISDGYKETQRKKIQVLKAKEYFDKIILTDELGSEYWKPHTRSFELMKEFFQVNYDEMMYVGDNPEKDFYIKKSYPIRTIRIMREESVYTEALYYGNIMEDNRIFSLEELKSCF